MWPLAEDIFPFFFRELCAGAVIFYVQSLPLINVHPIGEWTGTHLWVGLRKMRQMVPAIFERELVDFFAATVVVVDHHRSVCACLSLCEETGTRLRDSHTKRTTTVFFTNVGHVVGDVFSVGLLVFLVHKRPPSNEVHLMH